MSGKTSTSTDERGGFTLGDQLVKTITEEEGNEVLHSKIVPFLHEGAAVSTSRNDTDYVVTEYGIAWLRGANVAQRAEALINIAHPDFRDGLRAKAEEYGIW